MYEYTDDDNDSLHVWESNEDGKTYVGTVEHEGPATGVMVRNEDAPAVALAILEAAGIEGWNYSDDRLASAVVALTEHKRQQDAKAEREAEDAKVREFITAIDGLSPTSISSHERDLYNAARKFFEEA
jgi:hypothetical protein